LQLINDHIYSTKISEKERETETDRQTDKTRQDKYVQYIKHKKACSSNHTNTGMVQEGY